MVQEISEEEFDEQVEEDIKLEELTKLYPKADVESSKEVKETSKLICYQASRQPNGSR